MRKMHLHFLPNNFTSNHSQYERFHNNRNKIKAKYFLNEHKRSPEIPFASIVARIPELIRVHQTRILMIKSLHLHASWDDERRFLCGSHPASAITLLISIMIVIIDEFTALTDALQAVYVLKSEKYNFLRGRNVIISTWLSKFWTWCSDPLTQNSHCSKESIFFMYMKLNEMKCLRFPPHQSHCSLKMRRVKRYKLDNSIIFLITHCVAYLNCDIVVIYFMRKF